MPDKVTRAAFIYLEPKPRDDNGTFAQCWSCRMFVPEVTGLDGGRCIIHGSKVDIDADDSCGFYVDWPTEDGEPNPQVVHDHAEELAKNIPGSVTPEESGLIDDRVQCHRCAFAEAGATVCGLYRSLSRARPRIVDLDDRIKPHACCNAWTDRGSGDGDED
jgi:hypothetical protein